MRHELSKLIIDPKGSIMDALEAIQESGTRGVFVCDEDRELLGIVMDSDVRKAVLKKLDLGNSVKTIMKTNPVTIPHDLNEQEKTRLFIKSNKLLVPITDYNGILQDYLYLNDVVEQMPSSVSNDKGIMPPSKVLVIGGAGYIGSPLVDKLLRMGYQVRCLDQLLYSKDSMDTFKDHPDFEFIRGDCRNQALLEQALTGVDGVVHLGEIVGDPACSVNEDFTIDINYMATNKLVESCIKLQVPRLVFTSSCSVYGQNDEIVNETSELNPVSLYARCKIECERAILAMANQDFCPTILRLSTVHGRSFRPRFDLVVNLLAVKALVDKQIQIFGGDQWRPFISVKDICNGIVQVLQSNRDKVNRQIFNLGDSRENYTIDMVGDMIRDSIPGIDVQQLKDDVDKRNYRVSFDKIRDVLGFTCEFKIEDTIKEIREAVERDNLYSDYDDPKYHNFKTLKY